MTFLTKKCYYSNAAKFKLFYFYYSQIPHSGAKSRHVWIDMGGQISPSICLKSPLIKKVHTLAHSARLSVQRSMKSQQEVQQFKIPFLLTRYLQEYPHKM